MLLAFLKCSNRFSIAIHDGGIFPVVSGLSPYALPWPAEEQSQSVTCKYQSLES